MPGILTQRLSLVCWSPKDIADANRLWGDPQVMRHLDKRGALNPAQVEEKLQDEIQRQVSLGVQYWRTTHRKSDLFIGCCGLRPVMLPDGESDREFEIGFHIVSQEWGKGYASEAACGVIDFAFQAMKLTAVYAGHGPSNLQSKKVLERLGFKRIRDQLFRPTGEQHPIYELTQPRFESFRPLLEV